MTTPVMLLLQLRKGPTPAVAPDATGADFTVLIGSSSSGIIVESLSSSGDLFVDASVIVIMVETYGTTTLDSPSRNPHTLVSD